MVNARLDFQTRAMLSSVLRFVTDLFPDNNVSFDNLEVELLKGNSLERLRVIVIEQLQTHTAKQSLHKDYSTPNVEEATWNTLNVLFRLHDKLRLLKQTVGLEAVTNLIEDCIAESETPSWLEQRIVTHLPLIVIQELCEHGRKEMRAAPDKPYVVYIGQGLPIDCDAADLKKYRLLGRQGHFDIFIDDVPPHRSVLVRGEPGKFTPGRGMPYKLLRYLLSRVGRDVSYTELRRSVWTLRQIRTMSGLSKTIYDRLSDIRCQLRKSSLVTEDEPDKWLKKTSVRGVVYVWENLNSCLITMPASLRSHPK